MQTSMPALIERIRAEATYLGNGIIKVDGFVNHQIDPGLTTEMGRAFAAQFADAGVTKIITAEVSGIAPSLATAQVLDVPLVYARKHRPITMPEGTLPPHYPNPVRGVD